MKSLLPEVNQVYSHNSSSNILTVNVVKHFLLDQEGAVEILDETLSEACTLIIAEVAGLKIDVAFPKTVLNSGEIGLMCSLDTLVL